MSRRDPLVGATLLGRYRIVDRMAKGGMGVVYLARSEGAAGFVKPVVVKRILPELDEQETIGMFVREAKILGNLQHPGIAGIVEFAEEDDAYVMVLEYVHGFDLAKWRGYVMRTRKRFDLELALHVVIKVLEALDYAHTLTRADGSSLGIVHRDISPSNVIVDLDGHVKLLDFGVARMGGETGVYETEEITVKGKLPYLSPELLAGSQPAAANDVYSTAVVLHELLMGRNVFRSKEPAQVIHRVLNLAVPKLTSQREDVPDELDVILAKALHKEPSERYQSAAELAEELRQIRILTTEEAQAELTKTVRADYPQIPATLKIQALSEREELWRNPPEPAPEAPARELPGPTPSQPPTVAGPRARAAMAAPEVATEPPPPSGGSGRWIAVGVGLALGLGGVVAALFFTGAIGGAASGETEQVFVVQQPSGTPAREVSVPDEEVDEPLPTPDVEPPDDEREETPPATQGATTGARRGRATSVPPRGEALTATFARHGRRIEACFRGAAVEGRPELSVRFVLAQNGTVQSAQVLPSTLAGTELGRCVSGVARSVRFAPQERDGVSFRIPLTVQRR